MMQWGWKLVGVDLTTDDHAGGRYRYRPGEWHEADAAASHDSPCPRHPGDGLCVARTFAGAASGGQRIGSSAMLLVGFEPGDVLAGDGDKVRVRRLWVHPDASDPVRIIATRDADLRDADLRYADLRDADLRDAVLSGAVLSGAVLSGAVLSGADLRDAVLSDAVLSGADLRYADLRDAILSGAVLRYANLRYADLRGAVLSGADLRDARLSGADLRDAVLSGAVLSGAKADEHTRWPDGFDPAAAGVVFT